MNTPMGAQQGTLTLEFDAKVEGDNISGNNVDAAPTGPSSAMASSGPAANQAAAASAPAPLR